MLDDGRLTDGQGRTVDFTNTLIVMTSNLGSDRLASDAGSKETDSMHERIMDVVRRHFRPEFLNRLDEILFFHRLTRDEMRPIVNIQLRHLENLLVDRQIRLELDDTARDWLADAGFDPAYGARPLKRVIQRSLQNPLASLILEGAVGDGDTVRVTAGKNGLEINRKAALAA